MYKRKVIQYDRKGKIINMFDSLTERIALTSIYNACRGYK